MSAPGTHNYHLGFTWCRAHLCYAYAPLSKVMGAVEHPNPMGVSACNGMGDVEHPNPSVCQLL